MSSWLITCTADRIPPGQTYASERAARDVLRLHASACPGEHDAREVGKEITPEQLWRQAGGGTPSYSRDRYRELMREHGYLRDLAPGEQRESLPCGWPGPVRDVDEACCEDSDCPHWPDATGPSEDAIGGTSA